MKLKDTFMSSPIFCQNFEISVYFKKFSFVLQTIFPFHNLEADNFFSQLQLAIKFFTIKVTPPIKNNGPSLYTYSYAKFRNNLSGGSV